MKMWMFTDIYYCDMDGLHQLKRRHIYDVPQEWGKYFMQMEVAGEYLKK